MKTTKCNQCEQAVASCAIIDGACPACSIEDALDNLQRHLDAIRRVVDDRMDMSGGRGIAKLPDVIDEATALATKVLDAQVALGDVAIAVAEVEGIVITED